MGEKVKKGYVMEVKEEHLLVVTEEQKFIRLRKKIGVDAGEEIIFADSQVLDIPKANSKGENYMKKIKQVKPMAMAAAMILIVVLSMFAMTGGDPEAQYLLGFDVNPGIQIEVGEGEEVLRVHAMNQEAKDLELESLEGEGLEVFLGELLEGLEAQGHLNSETAQVMLSYADLMEDNEASEDFVERVTRQMETYFAEKNMNVEINMLLVDEENYENARVAGITLGKFQLIQEIERQEESQETGDATGEPMDEAGEEGEDIIIDTEKYRDTPVRELLEHPVFERHPRDRKAEGLHPVFDVHPRDWNKEDGERPHPVFDEDSHPRNRGRDDEDDSHPVFDEDSHPRNRGRDDEDDSHPVFDEDSHPRNRGRDDEDDSHPVFDEDSHPRNRGRDDEDDSHPVFDKDSHPRNRGRDDGDDSHPVFDEDTHPGNRNRDNGDNGSGNS